MCWPDQSASSKAREDPDDRPLRDAVDDLLHPRFEHPDERLSGVDVVRAGLEREPFVSEPSERLDDQRRLADTRLADDQDRPGRDEERAPTSASTAAIRLPTSVAGGRCARIDDTPERAEEVDVDRRRLPLLERGPERSPRRDVGRSISSRTSGCRLASSVSSSATVQLSPGCDTRVRKRETSRASGLPAQSSSAAASTGGNHLPVAAGERAEEQLPFAPLAALEATLGGLRPAGRRRATGGDRGHGAGAKELRPPERDIRERLVVDARGIGEQFDEPFEFIVEVELVDVDPLVRRRELLPERRSPPGSGSSFRLRTLWGILPPTLSRVQEVLSVPNEVAAELGGIGDGVLNTLRDRLHCTLRLRGNQLTIEGADDRVAAARAVVDELVELVEGGHEIGPDTVGAVVAALDQTDDLREVFEDVVWRHRGKKIAPKTMGQKRYVDAIRECTVTFGIGPAGTGKTYLAMALAVAALAEKQVARIILTRPAVEAGERLGFLPGDMLAKVDPYLRPLFDALYDMLDADKLTAHMERGVIEVAPLAFMRGRTLNDSFIILDEAQNTSPEQMQMFLTRLGFGSKVVITGDVTQVDLPRDQASGLIQVRDILDSIDGIAFVEFTHQDVVRHKLVQRIVEAYKQHAEETGTARKR